MNSLHQLLDAIDANAVGTDPTWSDKISSYLLRSTRVESVDAQCFDVGDMSAICELQIVPELARLPYRTVWFEGRLSESDLPDARIGVLACGNDHETIDCVCYICRNGRWNVLWLVHEVDRQTLTYRLRSDRPEEFVMAKAVVFSMLAFCCALNCTNVERREHVPGAKLQKARSRRGKVPLFSYWTLELKGRRDRGQLMGGTHGSPRVHLRRGHPRQYRPGKWTWVQACAVGSVAAGIVHKDYNAERLLAAAPNRS